MYISELVEVKETDKIKIDMMYPKLGMKNKIDGCYLIKDVYNKLLEACEYLPEGYSFKIWDAYRTFSLQEELYNKYSKKIENIFNLDDYSFDKKQEFINHFVAYPDKRYPPAHTTGSAIDITLIKNGKDIDMGCSFDEFSPHAYTNYYKDKDSFIHNNRMILYNCMVKAGFTNIETEFWHYDYGNRNWAERTKKDIMFDYIFDVKK